MKERLKFVLSYYLFWIIYFFLIKVLFLIYNFDHTISLDWQTISKILLFGFKLDLSFASYISLIPFLIIALSSLFPHKYLRYFLLTFTTIILFILTFISIVDLELYKAWGYRLDSTPLMYLNTPAEMLASAGSSPWVLLIAIMASTLISAFTLFYYFIYPQTAFLKKHTLIGLVFFVLLTFSLIIPIRGGFNQIPLNVSNVYFSKNNFANHAAINVSWNFFFSLINDNSNSKSFDYFPDEEAFKIVRGLQYPKSAVSQNILKTNRPNIILITWESLTAKVVAQTGGIKGVTPNFDQLCHEGFLFSNMYAAGDRSDKGLAAILSGYPALARGSVLNFPKKSEKLPSIALNLAHEGYETAFYYGGEMEFANIKSYFVNNFEKIVSKEDFSEEEMNSKWGAHDHVVFNKFFNDISLAKQPFFYNLFTLSSHEPFDIPTAGKYSGSSKDSLFMSSVHYTDKVLGNFINKAKKEKWWNNTLVIITADHGTPLPGNTKYNLKEKYHIPCLMLGGALNTTGVFNKVCSQIDISRTLLDMLQLNSNSYIWSNNILNPNYPGHAYYVFKDGFGFITQDQYLLFDHTLKNTSFFTNPDTVSDIKKGKALSQMIATDFRLK